MTEASLAISDKDINVLANLMGTPTVPARYTSVQDMVATVLVGKELGLAPMTALSELFIVNGKVQMSGKTMLSLVQQAGHRIRVELSTKKATATGLRLMDDEWVEVGSFTFTWEDAEHAGLSEQGAWTKYPADMLGWKAVSRCARFCFPEAITGYMHFELDSEAEGEMLEADETTFVLDEEGGIVEDGLDAEAVADFLDGEVVTS